MQRASEVVLGAVSDVRRFRFPRPRFGFRVRTHMPEVLFICTGNYYRSRFAEALFNHTAERRGLDWRAFSRGLATHLVAGAGEISPHTRVALSAREIALRHTSAKPTSLAISDLERAARVIALKEAEHRALMRTQFPEWENRIEYWHIHDLDAALPDTALPEIEQLTSQLIEEIAGGAAKVHTRGRRK